jgi:hypothetical protein
MQLTTPVTNPLPIALKAANKTTNIPLWKSTPSNRYTHRSLVATISFLQVSFPRPPGILTSVSEEYETRII